jgi:hypothetical protein
MYRAIKESTPKNYLKPNSVRGDSFCPRRHSFVIGRVVSIFYGWSVPRFSCSCAAVWANRLSGGDNYVVTLDLVKSVCAAY